MGNTVVFKAPRRGVLLHRPLLEAFRDCFPPGVVNTVSGEGRTVVGPLMSSGGVSCLAFIGTSRAADILKKQHPKPHRLRCVLGLEAKNPAVILADADLDLAVRECTLGSLSFNGQRCTALKIIFVPRSMAEDFVQRLSRAVEALRFGMPWVQDVKLTPMVSEQVDFVRSLIDDAVARGARVVNEAGGVTHGTFLHPAVLYPVAAGMRVFTEEQFGPIVAVAEYEDVREVVEYMIASNYGQQVSIFGKDPETIARLIDPVVNLVCRVNLNSQCQRGPDVLPFTGRKDSAEGTLSVSDALRVFSIRTLVAAKGSALNKQIISDIVRNRRSAFLSDDFIL